MRFSLEAETRRAVEACVREPRCGAQLGPWVPSAGTGARITGPPPRAVGLTDTGTGPRTSMKGRLTPTGSQADQGWD